MTLDVQYLRSLPGWEEFLNQVRLINAAFLSTPEATRIELLHVLHTSFCEANHLDDNDNRAEFLTIVTTLATPHQQYPAQYGTPPQQQPPVPPTNFYPQEMYPPYTGIAPHGYDVSLAMPPPKTTISTASATTPLCSSVLPKSLPTVLQQPIPARLPSNDA